MSLRTPILFIISALILALALGIGCETGEQVTEDDIEAIADALSDPASPGSGQGNTPVLWPTIVTREKVEELLAEGADINVLDSNGNTLLHQAAMTADPDVIDLLIEEGADIESTDERGNTPLHAAARYGETTTVLALANAGANVDATNSDGETPLYLAVREGDLSMAQTLLDRGADTGVDAGPGSILLVTDLEMAKLLLDRGADPNVPEGGYLSIHYAAERGDVAMVQFLLDNGADVNAPEEFGQTPLHFAMGRLIRPGEPLPPATMFMGGDVEESRRLSVVRLLLDRGANIEAVASNAVGSWGLTPLLKAAEMGHVEIVQLLLDRGANVLARDSRDQSVLVLALDGEARVMQLLIDRGVLAAMDPADSSEVCRQASLGGDPGPSRLLLREHCTATGVANGTPRPVYGPVSTITPHLRPGYTDFDLQWVTETPLHRAVVQGNVNELQALLAQGADPNAPATIRLTGTETDREWPGMTPLHLAALSPNPAVIEGLLDGGANVNSRAQHGLTPLHVAARLATTRHVQALLDGGAQIEARDDDGRTPLHWALEGDPNVIALLLDLGADIEAKNSDGFTPLHWAAAFTDLEGAAFFLMERAADITATDDMGRTPCQIYSAANQGLGTSGMIELLCPAAPAPGPTATRRIATVAWDEETPLHRAAYEGSQSEVRNLLDRGADMDAKLDLSLEGARGAFPWNGVAPLHLAALNPDTSVTALLIDRGAPVDVRDEYQRTPLMVAVMWFPNPGVITLLLDRGADIEAVDYNRMSPLFLAAQQANIYPSPSINEGHQAIIALLLDRGAQMGPGGQQMLCNTVFGVPNFDDDLEDRLCGRTPKAPEPLAEVTWASETPLHRAAYSGLPSEVRRLLAQGADVNATATMRPGGTDLTGATPLHAAAFNPNVSVARLLLDNGADVDVTLSSGHTPLHLTAAFGNEDVAVLLLQRGADIEAREGNDSSTPLMVAATYNRPGVSNALLDRGADVSATNSQGHTACQVALNYGRTRSLRWVERLCMGYSPPTPIPTEGVHWFTETPLHRAAYGGTPAEVSSLLDQGAAIEATADVSIDDRYWYGVTPLHMATLNPDIAVAGLLLDRGASIHARTTQFGFSVLQFAQQSRSSDMIGLLLSRGAQE